ncbi:acyl carrier protein [Niveispirillum sp.]|uniref:acyl carrier protein n=1 Tax=Niveispirillum sp. TaxID=1917217 RepID=UPI001B75FE57|nr:acyl carrier protein [Niveispirillum sp.]MBP7338255.1 acyl carrier protein [Niveispirillum sp.]
MTRAEFLAALEEMLELDAGSLSPDMALDSLDSWDSLAVISFIALVDEHFDHVVAGEDLAKAKTIGDLLALTGADLA